MSQGLLFSDEEVPRLNDWRREYIGMPEYNNSKFIEPLITASFKFRTEEDFNSFMAVVKKELFQDKRVFDGNQSKELKSTWFPLEPRPSENIYIVENEK